MSRLVLLAIPAFAVAACSGREAGDVPAQTLLVGDSGGYPLTPALSPDGTRLAWSQPVGGQARIHVGAPDGSNPVQLSKGTWDIDPLWSPDGKWISFFGESPAFDLWVVAAEGGEPRQLTSGPAVDQPLGWLPDGSGIVFARANEGEVRTLVVPLDGGPLRPLVAHRGGNQYAVLSPDGKHVSVEIIRGGESTIWVQNVESGAIRQLTTEGFEAANPSRNTWAPDSRHLVYTSRRTGTNDLWTANIETGELKQITSDIRDDVGHAWSPDGRWIAFVSDRGGQWDVWIVPATGGDALRVTNDFAQESYVRWEADGSALYFGRSDGDGQIGITAPGREPITLVNWPGYVVDLSQASLSPDEKTLLFVGTRSGNNDIWSVPVSGGEPTPFISGPLEEREPRYSPDGSAIAFVSNRTGSRDLWVMPASGGEPRRLTEWPSNETTPVWSPDGSMIAFVSDREASASDLWVVPAQGGTPRRISRFDLPSSSRPAWSPDGKSLYMTVGDPSGARLFRFPVAGSRPQELRIRTTPGPAGGGALSPDGAWYAYFAIEGGFAHLEITSTTGGTPRRLRPTSEPVWNTRPVWSPDGSKIAVSDWRFDDDATEDVIEFTVSDGTSRRLTSRPKAYDSPLAYTSDGRVLFASTGQDARIVRVSVARLLAPK